jgi:hypothetical protein
MSVEDADLPSVEFPQPYKGTQYLSKKTFEFSETSKLKKWAEDEFDFWKGLMIQKDKSGTVLESWSREQADVMKALIDDCATLEQATAKSSMPPTNQQQAAIQQRYSAISNRLARISDGTLLSRDNPISVRMLAISKRSHLSAWAYRAIMHPDFQSQLEQGRIKQSTLFQGAIDAGASDDLLANANVERARLDEIFEESQAQLRTVDNILKDEKSAAGDFHELAEAAERERRDEWQKRLERIDAEWAGKLEVYNNKLALLAPTTYWTTKSVEHKNAAQIFGGAFLFVLAAALVAFVWYQPHLDVLTATSAEKSIVATMAPIVAFGFAVIWILRILGRQLAKHLQLRDDAKERETMVMTFLAMMNEKETTGVSEKDRILILHALFRPASGSAPDDAPPAHWFDLLTSRLGKPGS